MAVPERLVALPRYEVEPVALVKPCESQHGAHALHLLRRQRPDPPVRRAQSAIETAFSSVWASMAEKLFSRPRPLVFMPPHGRRGSTPAAPLIRTAPARSLEAARCAFDTSRVHTYAVRP